MKEDTDSDLSEEIHDQLNQLWTNAKDKRKELLSHLTSYSKRNKSSLNNSLQPKGFQERQPPSGKHNKLNDSESGLMKEVVKLRQQLQQEVSQGRHKQIELDRLKKTADKLALQKQYLAKQLQQTFIADENNSKTLNESSILPRGRSDIKTKQRQGKSAKNINQINSRPTTEKIEDLSKERLIELVRSTSEYRSYVFYYDSNQLSYLKRLNEQHRKNCQKTPGERQKQLWAPIQLVQQLKAINTRQQLNLSQKQIQKILVTLKSMFQKNEAARLQKLKKTLSARLKKVQRTGQNSVPYQIVQVTKAKERELSRWTSTKRSNSLFR